jgi:hypothetical protein
MMERRTKTDLRRAPFQPRGASLRPAPTGDEEQAFLFGEITAQPEASPPPPPAQPVENITRDLPFWRSSNNEPS